MTVLPKVISDLFAKRETEIRTTLTELREGKISEKTLGTAEGTVKQIVIRQNRGDSSANPG